MPRVGTHGWTQGGGRLNRVGRAGAGRRDFARRDFGRRDFARRGHGYGYGDGLWRRRYWPNTLAAPVIYPYYDNIYPYYNDFYAPYYDDYYNPYY